MVPLLTRGPLRNGNWRKGRATGVSQEHSHGEHKMCAKMKSIFSGNFMTTLGLHEWDYFSEFSLNVDQGRTADEVVGVQVSRKVTNRVSFTRVYTYHLRAKS